MTVKDDTEVTIPDNSFSETPGATPPPSLEGEEPTRETPLTESVFVSSSTRNGAISNDDNDDDDHETRRELHWKSSIWAVGNVEITWADSRRSRRRRRNRNNNSSSSEQDTYLNASAWVCPLLRTGRVGNMAILRQSYQHIQHSNTSGTASIERRPKIDCVMGPYWIVPVVITYPIILLVSAMAARKVIILPVAVIVVWSVLTVTLLVSLSLVACRNPGIMYRYREPPPHNDEDANDWRWNDQALTFRPRHAKYDPECAVVIEGFDHTYVVCMYLLQVSSVAWIIR